MANLDTHLHSSTRSVSNMLVPELLLQTLEELLDVDFKTLKWYLSMTILESCKPIPKCRLETASRTQTVSCMTDSYGEESAVNITVEILRKMNNNNSAQMLKSAYAGAVDDEFVKVT